VDLAARKTRVALAGEICDICHHVGFFTIVNHGVPSESPNTSKR